MRFLCKYMDHRLGCRYLYNGKPLPADCKGRRRACNGSDMNREIAAWAIAAAVIAAADVILLVIALSGS